MKYLGIDYGTKRVGIALSDEGATFALPLKVLPNSKNNHDLLDSINEVVCDNEVKTIVLGESKDFKGEDNKIMDKIREFKEVLENKLQIPVILEPEFLTSHAAEQFQGKNDMHDASAAALILQSYLDRLKNN
jgi:putative Holliday junction resolvase